MEGVFITTLLVIVPVAVLASNGCPSTVPSGVLQKSFGDHCFAFYTKNYGGRDFDSAERVCRDSGGILALPKTKDVDDFLIQVIKNDLKFTDHQFAWIGLTDMDKENIFKWEDSTPFHHHADFDNFGTMEGPRKGWIQHELEDCVAMDSDGQWRDFYCSTHRFGPIKLYNADKDFICQFDKESSTTPSPPCPSFSCDKDCGLTGYKANPITGCLLCECDE